MKNFLKNKVLIGRYLVIFGLLVIIVYLLLNNKPSTSLKNINKDNTKSYLYNQYKDIDYCSDENCDLELIEIKDKKVYYNSVLVEEADPETFKKIHRAFAIDKNNVYIRRYNSNYKDDYIKNQKVGYYMKKVNDADTETFKVLTGLNNDGSGRYAIDKYNIFHDDKIIESADIDSFEILDYYYSKDKNNVYYFDNDNNFKIIKSADPETFELVEDYHDDFVLARDEKHCYDWGEKIKMSKCEEEEEYRIEQCKQDEIDGYYNEVCEGL